MYVHIYIYSYAYIYIYEYIPDRCIIGAWLWPPMGDWAMDFTLPLLSRPHCHLWLHR